MTREERLKFCNVCNNKKIIENSHSNLVVCSLTNSIADFEGSCDLYIENIEFKIAQNLSDYKTEISFRLIDAGSEKRFANFIIDLIFGYFFVFVSSIFFGLVLVFSIGTKSLESSYLLNLLKNKFVLYLLGIILFIMYYTFFESITGRTMGKLITRTKVVDRMGKIPCFMTILLRSFCRFIPFEEFSFFGSGMSGWHDTLTDTRVVEVKKVK